MIVAGCVSSKSNTLALIAFTKAAPRASRRSARPITEALPAAPNGRRPAIALTIAGSLQPAKLVATTFTSERFASLRTASGRSLQRQPATNAASGPVTSAVTSIVFSNLNRPWTAASR